MNQGVDAVCRSDSGLRLRALCLYHEVLRPSGHELADVSLHLGQTKAKLHHYISQQDVEVLVVDLQRFQLLHPNESFLFEVGQVCEVFIRKEAEGLALRLKLLR